MAFSSLLSAKHSIGASAARPMVKSNYFQTETLPKRGERSTNLFRGFRNRLRLTAGDSSPKAEGRPAPTEPPFLIQSDHDVRRSTAPEQICCTTLEGIFKRVMVASHRRCGVNDTRALVIRGNRIFEDVNGHICMDDLWRAAKASPSKAPSKWRVTRMAKALIAELEKKITNSSLKENKPVIPAIGRGST